MPLRDGTGPTGEGPGTGRGGGPCVPSKPNLPPPSLKRIAYKGTIQGRKPKAEKKPKKMQ